MKGASEINLPIARNDEETLKERMTGNAYKQILPARYLSKNDKGEVIEEQEELFERVAQNVALAEAVYVNSPVYIEEKHIKPDHPRREALISEVFEGSTKKVLLTEENAKHLSYDAFVPDILSNKIRNRVEFWKSEFQDAMEHLKFTPNTPTLINAGNELQQLSACFVDSPSDDMADIHQTAKEAALIFQSGGGNGYDFSDLRPYGDTVGSTGGIASGPITFMQTFDQVCQTVAQGGVRRGAQMGVMRVDHPDIPFFIHAKNKDVSLAEELRLNDPDDPTHNSFGDALEEARELIEDERVPQHLRNAAEGHLSNFNISVTVTDDFMEALEEGDAYKLMNPRTGEQHVANKHTKQMYDWFGLGEYVEVGEPLELPAEEVWERMVEGAWENGEPGVIYLDQVNKMHSFDTEKHPEHTIRATNPCAEQALEEYESCTLGHINLSTVVDDERVQWDDFSSLETGLEGRTQLFLEQAIDWTELQTRIELGVRFLDNVVTMSNFPFQELEDKASEMRKIGLGVMGLAQLYIQLGVEYGSPEGNEIARQLMREINHRSKKASHGLAKERGSFPDWDDSKYANPTEYPEWFRQLVGRDPEEWEDGFPIRNHNTTTIAPTGTTSMVANTSSGCEPIYNVAFFKNVSPDIQGDEMLVEFDSFFLRVLEANDVDAEAVKEEALTQMQNNEYEGVHGLSEVPTGIADLFITADQLTGKEHATVLCACQEGVDSGISKTCNFPHDATVEDMEEVYRYIYENGGKSVTVYRDGTRTKQVLTTRADNQGSEDVDADDVLKEEFGFTSEELGEMLEKAQDVPQPRDVPDRTHGTRYRIKTGYGKLYVHVNEDERGPIEVFATIGKSGGFTEQFCEGIARMISLSLRWGVPMEKIIKQLEGIRSPQSGWEKGEQVQSVPDGIALALKRHIGQDAIESVRKELEVEETNERTQEPTTMKDELTKKTDGGVEAIVANGENPECDACGAMLVMQEGCEKCEACGWSKCG